MNQTSHSSTVRNTAPGPAPAGSWRLTADDVVAARERLRGALRLTPCSRSLGLRPEGEGALWLKCDDLQVTGSFKERGARHALVMLNAVDRKAGVVAASAGNHALGLAYHGRELGVPVTLVMATHAARVKVERCRALGATVVLAGEDFAAATEVARQVALEAGARFVHPFDEVSVMAGQGTVALEVLEQVPELEAVVVPVGGGGLLAGVASVIKSRAPWVKVVAVEPDQAPSLSAAWEADRPTRVKVGRTLADGLAVSCTGALPFASVRGRVDAVVTVNEDEIAWAMLRLFETQRAVVEGAGAAALAAVLAGRCPELTGRRTVVLVGGGNVDADTFAAALRRGIDAGGPRQSLPAA